MNMKRLVLFNLLLACALPAQTAVAVKATNTQAIISYTAPDNAACTLDVRETGAASVVNDMNATLFTGANLDSRSTGASIGRQRVVVVGLRNSGKAADSKVYSRALQADTNHTATITCSGAPVVVNFRTANLAPGNTFLEGIPGNSIDPDMKTGWPTLSWSDRTQQIIDPQTGLLIRRVTLAKDTFNMFPYTWSEVRGTGAWTGVSNITTDDAAVASYSSAARDWLFLGHAINSNPSFDYSQDFIPQLQSEMNAYCTGGDCATASADDRTIEVCVTITGASCIGNAIEQVLLNCPSSCTSGTYRFTLGDNGTNSGMLAAWAQTDPYAFKTVHPFDQYSYSGTVNRSTNAVTAVSGKFNVNWAAGSVIKINGTDRLIASVESDVALTLSGAPAGTETGVAFSALNFGIMIRKKTTSTTPITIQWSRPVRGSGLQGGYTWDPTGQYDQYSNCSDAMVSGVAGEMGVHCHFGGILYWVGMTTGTVIPIGRTFVAARGGTDGWPSYSFSDGYWDKNNGNRFYGFAYGLNGHLIIQQWDYNGTNTVPIDISAQQVGPVECGSAPCWVITNLTKQSLSQTVNQQITAFDATMPTKMPLARFQMLALLGNTSPKILLRALTDSVTNDVMAYYAVYDAATNTIVGATDTWSKGVLRWSAVHGFDDAGDSTVVKMSPTNYRGQHTGTESYRGNGPYVARIVNGVVPSTGAACPARPGGSPIPALEWPTGNNCVIIVVDGEPGDPTPMKYTTGTITTSGVNVTGAGTNWPSYTTGYKMKISGSYYTFTYVSATSGTLSPTPPVVAGSAYTLFLEPTNNAATGATRVEDAYLMDAAVGDIFGVNANPGCSAGANCGLFGNSEYMRILIKTGNTWEVERGYNKTGVRHSFLAVASDGYVTMLGSSCSMLQTYACGAAYAYWYFGTDPNGNAVVSPTGTQQSNGGGHGFTRPTHEISATAQFNCPTIDGDGSGCYNIRTGVNLPATTISTTNNLIAQTPVFAGKIGMASPNTVESHPAPAGYLTSTFNPGERGWFLDARPMNGFSGGSVGSPAVNVTGTLYKFTATQVSRVDRKKLPIGASCGEYALTDISGPSSLITGTNTDRYKYCYASVAGECQPGSTVGDAFLNCPRVSRLYCEYADGDYRDLCFGGLAATSNGIVQTSYDSQNMSGRLTRVLTRGLSNYRTVDFYWNAKSAPTGKWAFIRTAWAHNFGHEVFALKLPPFPQDDGINRTTFIQVPVTIGASRVAAETHAIVEFGYNPSFYCTTRLEVCQKGTAADFSYLYEAVAPVSCASGCTINIPAISQRVVYYRVVRTNSGGTRLSVGQIRVEATP